MMVSKTSIINGRRTRLSVIVAVTLHQNLLISFCSLQGHRNLLNVQNPIDNNVSIDQI